MRDESKTKKQLIEEIQALRQENKKLQKSPAAKNSKNKNIDFVTSGPVMFFRWANEENWPVMFASPNIDQLGYTPEDFTSRRISYVSIIHPDDVGGVIKEVHQHNQAGHTFYAQEYRILASSGDIVWVSDYTIVRKDEHGNITFYDGILLNITERKKAEQALMHSEEHYRTLTEISPSMIYVIDRDGYVRFVNPAAAAQFHTSPAALTGKHIKDIFLPAQAEQHLAAITRVITTGSSLHTETFEFFPAGECWLDVNLSPLRDADNTVHAVMGVSYDITLRRQAEEAIRKSEMHYRNIFENAAEGILIAEVDSKLFKYANPAICALLGYTKDELLHMGIQDIHPKESLDRVIAEFNALARCEKILASEMPCLRKDGAVIYADITTSLIAFDNFQCNVGFFTDITERRQMEEALRESEKRYRSLYDGSRDGFCHTDMEGRLLEFNTSYQEMLGYTAEELLGKSYKEITPAYWETVEDRIVKEQILGRGYSDVYKKEYIRKDGTVFPIEHRSYLITKDGKNVGMWGVTRDITERKQTEEESAKLSSAIEHAQELIMISGRDGCIQYVNPAFERMLGFGSDEVLGKQQISFVQDSDELNMHRQVWATLAQGNPWAGNIKTKKKDGSEVHLEVTVSPMRDDRGAITSFVSIGRDITKELRMEEHLRQSQKMEAIGTLAGGIAHDFNNMLAAIMGYTELAGLDAPDGTTMKYNLEQALKAADRARSLVKQILAFSRKGEQERNPLELHVIIKEALKLLRASLPSTVDIVQIINEESGCVIADPTQVHQVLMNLCTNAAHAMEEKGGTLEVRLAPVELGDADTSMFSDLHPGPYLKLTVKDTGTGIAPAIVDRIFDPFFTTKEVSKGTGMGLSVVHGIIKSHGGSITVDSRPGKGTTFTILLPQAQVQASAQYETALPLPTGTECILFVDDEVLLVQLGSEILSSLGYTVATAKGGGEALEIFKKEPSKFDLVITDQTMPHMTGYELSQNLLQIRPDIPIILCTGFSETVDMTKARSLNIRAFVLKPMNLREIATTVRNVLNTA